MFELLQLQLNNEIASLENLNTTAPMNATVVTVKEDNSPPPPPPTKYGLTPIPLAIDPNESKIDIVEIPEGGINDYHVRIFSSISYETEYYAELVSLLATLTENSTVTIYINSPGGSLDVGAIISNAIQSTKANVITIAIGMVASAACLIWSYGKQRIATNGAILLYHMSSHGDWGNSEKIRIKADHLVRYVKEICVDPMLAQGLLTQDEAASIVDERKDVLIDAIEMTKRLEAYNARS